MTEPKLFLVRDRTSRIEDYSVREDSPDGLVIGRIYKKSHSPVGRLWYWALHIFPAVAADHGDEETREAAMAALKAQWLRRR